MKPINKVFFIPILMMCLIACDKDDNQIEVELKAYFEAFEAEAAQRNLYIDLSEHDLNGYIEDIQTKGTIGQCKSYSNGLHEVIIDKPYWVRATDLEKEYVVYHELGHCILGRKHENSIDENGACKSIMQSGDASCMNSYDIDNKEELLDELFEQ